MSYVDPMMVSVRKLLRVYRASNVLVHGVVSNVYEYHDTRRENYYEKIIE